MKDLCIHHRGNLCVDHRKFPLSNRNNIHQCNHQIRHVHDLLCSQLCLHPLNQLNNRAFVPLYVLQCSLLYNRQSHRFKDLRSNLHGDHLKNRLRNLHEYQAINLFHYLQCYPATNQHASQKRILPVHLRSSRRSNLRKIHQLNPHNFLLVYHHHNLLNNPCYSLPNSLVLFHI